MHLWIIGFDLAPNEKAGWNGKVLSGTAIMGLAKMINEQEVCTPGMYLRGSENGQKVDDASV